MKHKLLTFLALALPISLASCGGKSSGSSAKLKDVYKEYFKIGAAVNQTTREFNLVDEFSSITAENDMKWEAVHPSLDSYTWAEADTYINIAKKKGIGVRGHALVWHQAIPSYVFESAPGVARSKEEVLQIEREHINTVIEHFKDDVYCWDVCNEVIDDNPTSPLAEDLSNVYRESNWYNACGRDYIKVAFETADAKLKELGIRDKVQLIYNDYSNATPIKRDKTVAMLNWLIEENVPIDGIGLQSHYHLGNFDVDELERSIEIYSDLGLDVQITELDVEIYDTQSNEFINQDFKKYSDVPTENINMQASIYDRAFEVFRRHSDKISSVSFWGTSDVSCYMNNITEGIPSYGFHTNYPFLFDRQNKKKMAYYAVAEFGNKLNRTYNPYKSREGVNNVYKGDGNELTVEKFSTSNMQIVERPVKQEDGSYKVHYTNVAGYDYISSSVSGRLADFTYINIIAKGTPGKSIALRIYHSENEDENHNVLGNDVSFSLNAEFSIHTLKVKGVYKTRLDLARSVCIYPELAIAGAAGDFYYKDIWFSSEPAEGGTIENPGVDSGDTSKSVNGWTYEAWTGYTLYKDAKGTGVSYVEAKDYAFISKVLDIETKKDNALRFSFENVVEFDEQTVSHIRFLLRGDVSGHGISEEGYAYDIFFEEVLFTYNINDPLSYVAPDENNITTLEIPLANAISKIGNNHKNGYKLTVLIESFAAEKEVYDMSRDGKMIITECELHDGGYSADKYTQSEDAEFQYTLTEKSGVDMNVTYEGLAGNKYWPIIYRSVESTHDQFIVITMRNNGEDSVKVSVHAGILNDPRSDEKNHFFYPLANANGGAKNAAGYYTDGQEGEILPGESITFVFSVDSDEIYANDSISTIEFLIDNVYGDNTLRSGDVDIVSVNVQDEEPVVDSEE